MKETIQYIGEHLWAGQLGNSLISLALASAIIAAFAYIISHFNPEVKSVKKTSRLFFILHALSIFSAIGTMFFMMYNHYFEFEYVQHHTSRDIETRYLFAAFWEGQEGSFLLWSFWHCVIGLVLMFSSKKWEAPVMGTLSMVQAFLTLMVVGIYIGDVHIGSNPFTLLRENPELANAPFLQSADYLQKIDGRGLNPLLKNYWMTIHPPTLFLGFALTVVPFCFSIAGLLTRKHGEWQRTAIPWGFAGVLVLGTGILMGGAWAYEALSFGGFWAWDPVENASFVPWLTLVGAAHIMIVNKNTGHSYFSAYFFSIISFVLVLYSTFLTRSGILGESSVHAFTDLGMEKLLIYFLLFFMAIPIALFIENKTIAINYFLFSVFLVVLGEGFGHRSVFYMIWAIGSVVIIFYQYFKTWAPKMEGEESAWSREFWIFIGSLLLFLFAIVVSFLTSLPVFNKLFGTQHALKENGMKLYNVIGLLFGMFILLLSAITQYFKYKKTDLKKWRNNFVFSGLLAFVVAALISMRFYNLETWKFSTDIQRTAFFFCPFFIFFGLFSLFANFEYWLKILKGKIKNAGASIAHVGFAVVMIGCVISNSGKKVISENTSDKDISSLGKKFSNKTNIYLEKGDTTKMGEYLVTYKGKKKEGIYINYEVEYFKNKDGKNIPEFTLFPRVQLNERTGNAPEPGTKHFLTKDVYTDVTFAELLTQEEQELEGGWTKTENNVLALGKSFATSTYIIRLDSLKTSMTQEQFEKDDSLLVVTAVMSVTDMKKNVYKVYPKYILKNKQIAPEEYIDEKLGLKFVFWKINPEEGTVEITLSEKAAKKTDFIVMEAIEFPYINVLWLGCFVMILGTGLSVFYRIRQNKKSKIED